MVIKRNKDIVARKVHGSYFLIDISDNYSGDKCSIYEINETGMFLWGNINESRTVEELIELLKTAIIDDIDYQILNEDVREFINTLIIRGFAEA